MLRPYTNADIDAVISVWRAASAVAHPFLSEVFLDQEEKNIREIYVKHAQTWVMDIAGEVIGFISLIENEIGGLFLRPDFHGRGLGQAMVDLAYEEKGPLELEVFEKNDIGRRFYDRYGFKFKERRLHEASGEYVLRLVFPG